MRENITICVGVLLLLTGCRIGMTTEEFIPAQKPRGIHTSIRLSEARLEGELLNVNDTSFVMLIEREVVSVPYGSMRRIRLRQRSRLGIVYGRQPPRDTRAELRLLSRFPQGLSSDLLKQLLDGYGQERIRIVE